MRNFLIGGLIAIVFTSANFNHLETGTFSCLINDKPYVLHGIHAEMRVVTGGFKQLSVSNEIFTSFFFINPTPLKNILLNSSQNREAVVRYTNPVNFHTYFPITGNVSIDVLDEKGKTLSGTFEMELVPKGATGKKLKVTHGVLENIPIVYK